MQENGIKKEILDFIEDKESGTLFIHSDFFHIATSATIRQTLKRLVDEKIITRVFDGIYVKMEFSSILKKPIFPSPIQIANTIARKNKWSIFPSKQTALNLIGLSTQIENTYEFLSDGPYKHYRYLHYDLYFKRTANRIIKVESQSLKILIAALDAIGIDNLTHNQRKIMIDYVKKMGIKTNLVEQERTLPEWMYLTLKMIIRESMLND